MAKFRSLTTLTPADHDGSTNSDSIQHGNATSRTGDPIGDESGFSISGGGISGANEANAGDGADIGQQDGDSTIDGGRGDLNSGNATNTDSGDDFSGYTIDGHGTGTRPAESGRDTSPITGQTGRHKRKSCPCGRCVEWRRVSGVAIQVDDASPAPSRVSFDTLRSKSKNVGKDVSKKMLGIGISTLYALPHMLLPAGTADHFPLNDDEEKALVERLDAVLDMMPKRTKQRGLDAIAKIAPPIALLVTVGMITKPRIELTRMLLAQRAKQTRPNVNVPQTREATNTPDNVRDISTAPSRSGPTVMPEGSSTGLDAGSLARRAIIVPPDSTALLDPAL